MKFISQIFLSLFILIIIFSGCSQDKTINEDKFVKIYTDLVIAQDTIPNISSFNKAKNKIFERYNISSNDYENTIEYYNNDSERWKVFFAKVTAHIDSLKTKTTHK